MLGPVAAGGGTLTVRPLARRDGAEWRRQRIRDEASIAPWDATVAAPWTDRHTPAAWRLHRSALVAGARRGEVLAFAVELDGRFAGQVTVGGIQRGALRSGWIGYWIDSAVQGRGVASAAVALAVGHAFATAGLHRVEATIAPENRASLAVVTRLGFRQEGRLVRYLDVGGSWHDHLLFAVTAEEVPGGTAQLLARCATRSGSPE
ncbi:N-acetyltransferase GCN5 [Nakamurella endophytica]|uniref:N-acetyltransferase GCN5 n=1 Tax=Nakamurella endophytica TaxID=1748367 RepID=A0A917WBA9_9ACTN|nr:GNAT family protein [Nakamurella endophytica]GGL88174.1 N-acetyltransferase GCN5 [Nakamurella endophytica]